MTRTVRSLSALLLAASLGAPLGGCSRWRLRLEGEKAVRAYNDLLVVSYRTNDASGLGSVAGPDELRRLTTLIDLKARAALALESRLEGFEVLGVEPAGADGLVVRTCELWRYWDRPLRPGLAAGTVHVSRMWMTWELSREAGTWKVRSGRTERSEYLEPQGQGPRPDQAGRDGLPPAPGRTR